MSIIPHLVWAKPDSVIATDACLQGAGGISWIQGEYFHCRFPEAWSKQECSINLLELVTVVIGVKLWAASLKGRKLLIRCDNEVAVQVVNTGRAKNTDMLAWLRELCFCTALSDCVIKAVHLAGSENRLPDYLSRWEMGGEYAERFYKEVPAGWREVQVPENFFELQGSW